MKRTKEACGSCGYESYQLFSLDCHFGSTLLERWMHPNSNLHVCRACFDALLLCMKSVVEDFIREAEISATWRENHD